MLQRIFMAILLGTAPAGALAQQPLDCFNDEEDPLHGSPVNDLQPPSVPRLPAALRVTDGDIEALLDAIAAHERRRAAAPAAASAEGS